MDLQSQRKRGGRSTKQANAASTNSTTNRTLEESTTSFSAQQLSGCKDSINDAQSSSIIATNVNREESHQDADTDSPGVGGGSGGIASPPPNASECRRSSRKKVIKFDVRDLLNKNRKSHKIQIEARIDSNAPQPKSDTLDGNVTAATSSSNMSSKQKTFIEKSAIFRRYSISEQNKVSVPLRPPPLMTCVLPPPKISSLIQNSSNNDSVDAAVLALPKDTPQARGLSRTQEIFNASMLKSKQFNSLIVAQMESTSSSSCLGGGSSSSSSVSSMLLSQKQPPGRRKVQVSAANLNSATNDVIPQLPSRRIDTVVIESSANSVQRRGRGRPKKAKETNLIPRQEIEEDVVTTTSPTSISVDNNSNSNDFNEIIEIVTDDSCSGGGGILSSSEIDSLTNKSSETSSKRNTRQQTERIMRHEIGEDESTSSSVVVVEIIDESLTPTELSFIQDEAADESLEAVLNTSDESSNSSKVKRFPKTAQNSLQLRKSQQSSVTVESTIPNTIEIESQSDSASVSPTLPNPSRKRGRPKLNERLKATANTLEDCCASSNVRETAITTSSSSSPPSIEDGGGDCFAAEMVVAAIEEVSTEVVVEGDFHQPDLIIEQQLSVESAPQMTPPRKKHYKFKRTISLRSGKGSSEEEIDISSPTQSIKSDDNGEMQKRNRNSSSSSSSSSSNGIIGGSRTDSQGKSCSPSNSESEMYISRGGQLRVSVKRLLLKDLSPGKQQITPAVTEKTGGDNVDESKMEITPTSPIISITDDSASSSSLSSSLGKKVSKRLQMQKLQKDSQDQEKKSNKIEMLEATILVSDTEIEPIPEIAPQGKQQKGKLVADQMPANATKVITEEESRKRVELRSPKGRAKVEAPQNKPKTEDVLKEEITATVIKKDINDGDNKEKPLKVHQMPAKVTKVVTEGENDSQQRVAVIEKVRSPKGRAKVEAPETKPKSEVIVEKEMAVAEIDLNEGDNKEKPLKEHEIPAKVTKVNTEEESRQRVEVIEKVRSPKGRAKVEVSKNKTKHEDVVEKEMTATVVEKDLNEADKKEHQMPAKVTKDVTEGENDSQQQRVAVTEKLKSPKGRAKVEVSQNKTKLADVVEKEITATVIERNLKEGDNKEKSLKGHQMPAKVNTEEESRQNVVEMIEKVRSPKGRAKVDVSKNKTKHEDIVEKAMTATIVEIDLNEGDKNGHQMPAKVTKMVTDGENDSQPRVEVIVKARSPKGRKKLEVSQNKTKHEDVVEKAMTATVIEKDLNEGGNKEKPLKEIAGILEGAQGKVLKVKVLKKLPEKVVHENENIKRKEVVEVIEENKFFKVAVKVENPNEDITEAVKEITKQSDAQIEVTPTDDKEQEMHKKVCVQNLQKDEVIAIAEQETIKNKKSPYKRGKAKKQDIIEEGSKASDVQTDDENLPKRAATASETDERTQGQIIVEKPTLSGTQSVVEKITVLPSGDIEEICLDSDEIPSPEFEVDVPASTSGNTFTKINKAPSSLSQSSDSDRNSAAYLLSNNQENKTNLTTEAADSSLPAAIAYLLQKKNKRRLKEEINKLPPKKLQLQKIINFELGADDQVNQMKLPLKKQLRRRVSAVYSCMPAETSKVVAASETNMGSEEPQTQIIETPADEPSKVREDCKQNDICASEILTADDSDQQMSKENSNGSSPVEETLFTTRRKFIRRYETRKKRVANAKFETKQETSKVEEISPFVPDVTLKADEATNSESVTLMDPAVSNADCSEVTLFDSTISIQDETNSNSSPVIEESPSIDCCLASNKNEHSIAATTNAEAFSQFLISEETTNIQKINYQTSPSQKNGLIINTWEAASSKETSYMKAENNIPEVAIKETQLAIAKDQSKDVALPKDEIEVKPIAVPSVAVAPIEGNPIEVTPVTVNPIAVNSIAVAPIEGHPIAVASSAVPPVPVASSAVPPVPVASSTVPAVEGNPIAVSPIEGNPIAVALIEGTPVAVALIEANPPEPNPVEADHNNALVSYNIVAKKKPSTPTVVRRGRKQKSFTSSPIAGREETVKEQEGENPLATKILQHSSSSTDIANQLAEDESTSSAGSSSAVAKSDDSSKSDDVPKCVAKSDNLAKSDNKSDYKEKRSPKAPPKKRLFKIKQSEVSDQQSTAPGFQMIIPKEGFRLETSAEQDITKPISDKDMLPKNAPFKKEVITLKHTKASLKQMPDDCQMPLVNQISAVGPFGGGSSNPTSANRKKSKQKIAKAKEEEKEMPPTTSIKTKHRSKAVEFNEDTMCFSKSKQSPDKSQIVSEENRISSSSAGVKVERKSGKKKSNKDAIESELDSSRGKKKHHDSLSDEKTSSKGSKKNREKPTSADSLTPPLIEQKFIEEYSTATLETPTEIPLRTPSPLPKCSAPSIPTPCESVVESVVVVEEDPDPLKDIEKFIADGVNLLKRDYKLDDNDSVVGGIPEVLKSTADNENDSTSLTSLTSKKIKLDEEELEKRQTTLTPVCTFAETPAATPIATPTATPPPKSPPSGIDLEDSNSMTNGIRRSDRIKIISKTSKSLVGRGLVRDKERFSLKDDQETKSHYTIDDQRLDLAEVEAKNAKFLKDMEERLSNFRVIKENEYKCERIISKEAKKMICDCFLTAEEEERGELGCGEDCLNRLLMIECGIDCTVKDRCTNRRFQKFLCSPCRVFRTEKKGFGILADIEILPGEFIMEYVGEVINSEEFENRRNVYSQDKNKHYYFMALRSDAIIDATNKGNISRFINHSCDPNAETQKWTVNGELRIGFFSRKSIMPGEEITFDYQYQRYGKEAQRCYCESANCRGWIGQEPNSEEEEEEEEAEADDLLLDEDDEEDDDEEGDDEEDTDETTDADEKDAQKKLEMAAAAAAAEVQRPLVVLPSNKDELRISKDVAAAVASLKKHNKRSTAACKFSKLLSKMTARRKKKSKIGRDNSLAASDARLSVQSKAKTKPRYLEDPDIEDEVRFLLSCGLKNQSDTLRMSRLMVRAKLVQTRLKLLEILRKGELPCRRLFLDYHGMRLLHGWMSEATQQERDVDIRMALLETLENLPIANKTMLTDSKVLQTVRSWCGGNQDNNSSPSDDSSKESLAQSSVLGNHLETPTELQKLANKLTANWDNLPVIFRIPKRERIEQMKEHEREADRQYKAVAALEDDRVLTARADDRSRDRFGRSIASSTSGLTNRYKWGREKDKDSRERNNITLTSSCSSIDRRRLANEKSSSPSVAGGAAGNTASSNCTANLSKEQRREMFAAKVARDEAEKRLAEERREFETKCRFFGLDPKKLRPQDMPFCVNPSTGQWYSADRQPIVTPPSYAHVQVPVKPKSSNPADYRLPEKMDLPPFWKFAISSQGKLYYYHVKIRIPQWEPPIKILPLAGGGSGGTSTSASSLTGATSQQQVSVTTPSDSDSEAEGNRRNDSTDEDDDLIKGLDPVKLQAYVEKKVEYRRLQRYNSLVDERPISPRREEDRIYNQIEVRKYKENKEKIRKRKEEIRKRRAEAFKNGTGDGVVPTGTATTTTSTAMDCEKKDCDDDFDDVVPIQDYLLSSDEEETIRAECNNSPLIDKIVQGDKIVDELDALSIKRPLKRALKLLSTASTSDSIVASGSVNINASNSSSSSVTSGLSGTNVTPSTTTTSSSTSNTSNISSSSNSSDKHEHKKRKLEKIKSSKSKEKEISSKYRKIKEKFRCEIAGIIVQHLKPYRKDSCFMGRIKSDSDFNHLARKLTHFVMIKELKYCESIGQTLVVTESVKNKSREFIKKYMAKYGDVYIRPKNDPEFREIPLLQ